MMARKRIGLFFRTSAAVVPAGNTTAGRCWVMWSVYRTKHSLACCIVMRPRSTKSVVYSFRFDADAGHTFDTSGVLSRVSVCFLFWPAATIGGKKLTWLSCSGLYCDCGCGSRGVAWGGCHSRVTVGACCCWALLKLFCSPTGSGCVGGTPLVACRLAVRASIFFSSSATLLSVFFCRFLVGCVMMHARLAFLHLLQGPSTSTGSGSHLTLSPRQASQARGLLGSLGSPGAPSWPAPSGVSPSGA